MAGRPRRTKIGLWEYATLKQALMSKPDVVLRCFVTCQVEALDQLAVYLEIEAEHPEAAERIRAVAGDLGVPVHLDELLDGVDVLCEGPGEV